MKIIIAGGRDFDNYDLLKEKVGHYIQKLDKSKLEIVSGGARGADTLGEQFAFDNDLKCKIFPADWEKYKQGAGPKRNAQMGDYADGLIAFWDGKSKGTLHMINYAKKKGLQIKIIKY